MLHKYHLILFLWFFFFFFCSTKKRVIQIKNKENIYRHFSLYIFFFHFFHANAMHCCLFIVSKLRIFIFIFSMSLYWPYICIISSKTIAKFHQNFTCFIELPSHLICFILFKLDLYFMKLIFLFHFYLIPELHKNIPARLSFFTFHQLCFFFHIIS